jgi:acyl-coenzyme A synthetase/AMP-(fatty) acid ligase
VNYLFPSDAVAAATRHNATAITGIPPLWHQLLDIEWPADVARGIRYFANTGGRLPLETLERLRALFPNASPYLMYGLTEAFRSTYLEPTQVDKRPDSIGKAIPEAEIHVLRPDGTPCAVREIGELVHRGPLASLGYWNDPEATRARFRPLPGNSALPFPSIAVWSGDEVYKDEDGFLYFVGRKDAMIKTSGYRVSPTEVEEVAHASGVVAEAVALGRPDVILGTRIVLVVRPRGTPATKVLETFLNQALPSYLVPGEIHWVDDFPYTATGKIDRQALSAALDSRGKSSEADRTESQE